MIVQCFFNASLLIPFSMLLMRVATVRVAILRCVPGSVAMRVARANMMGIKTIVGAARYALASTDVAPAATAAFEHAKIQ